jgi:ubiquinone/menaquinone biosynthesis C-methylase UbiE
MKTSWDYNENLFDDLINFIKIKNGDPKNPESLCHFDQIHAGGVKASINLINLADIAKDQLLLDLGGGIGGVARMFAKKLNCGVISLDYSLNYSLTGKRLSELCNVKNIHFINADATFLPIKNNSIDYILLQHLNMNIKDKDTLLKECERVLTKKGKIIFHEWFIKDKILQDNLRFPLPWSDDSRYSFLITLKDFLGLGEKYGFEAIKIQDNSNEALKFYEKIYSEKNFFNPIFLNRDAEQIFKNIISALYEELIEVYFGVLQHKS